MNSMQQSRTIPRVFEDIVTEFPEKTAVMHKFSGDWCYISYAELLADAKGIAAFLKELGVGEGDAIVLPSVRGQNLCAQLLGILWVGAHYVFIDPEYPLERQQFICEETGARIGLFDRGIEPIGGLSLEWHRTEIRDPIPDDPSCGEQHPAYVMFTSGSTGTPKGVVVPHLSIHRLVCDTNYIDFSENQVFMQLSSLGFDASTLELWGGVLNGGTCVLHPETSVVTPAGIKSSIEETGVTTLWLTSSLYNLVISEHPESLLPLSQLLIGGEALSVSHVRLGLEKLPNTRIFNGYGPTENTTFTTIYPIPHPLAEDIKRIPIGYPIRGTICDLFDSDLRPVANGEDSGELIAFGEGLALGYLNRPELTAERFVEVECRDGVVRRGYRTGDLVLKNNESAYEYLQRNDKQVKIDGHRIEPGEIELYLNELEDIHEARVVVRIGPLQQKRLTAYVIGQGQLDNSQIRARLGKVFPAYMVPHFIVAMDALPINQNGKLDESRLPDPFSAQSSGNVRNRVVACWQEILGRKVGGDENFLDAGGTSLEALLLAERLADSYQVSLAATFVFEHPTINLQARHLETHSYASVKPLTTESRAEEAVRYAVIGIACRFPGAPDLDAYWQNLLDARETVSFFSDDELSSEIDLRDRNHPDYVKVKGIVEACDEFDAEFFGISPIEARLMDPQQRLMLQLCWHALEDASVIPGDDQYRTGVFVGMNWARYFQQYVLPNKELLDRYGLFNASLANESDFLSTRISYKLNLKGPSINVFTACSTGLVAIAQACASIEQGDCEVALAGGISISTPVRSGYLYQEGGMLSRDGHCRPFDADASGTTFNDGAGVVVLKREDLAIRDGDRIYASVIGHSINNDGEAKASYTAPSIGGQVEVYQAAIKNAGITPGSVGFVETHGTATPLGDPIEVEALKRVYSNDAGVEKNCALGSVKSNIGHTIHAAGIASFIKAVLAVRENLIPATLHFRKPNPRLELEKSRFFVNAETDVWKTVGLRRAAISSLGVGGTNGHIIIEEFGASPSIMEKADALGHSLLISAKSAESLELQIEGFRHFFATAKNKPSLRDAAYTLLEGRREFDHRAVICAVNSMQLTSNFPVSAVIPRGQVDADKERKIGWVFTGQGSQRLQMGAWLYRQEPTFRQLFDHGCQIVLEQEGIDVRKVVFANPGSADANQINQTGIVQPALFLLEYGLANLLLDRGCTPDFLIGHSIGEYAAAVLSGVMTFEDAVRIVARRGALMQSMPPGKMLVVKNLGRDDVAKYLDTGVCVAASNAPSLVALAGNSEAIGKVQDRLRADGVQTSLLETSHAFHSHMMEPIVGPFEEHIAAHRLDAPQIPIFATSTGELLTDKQASSPGFWSAQVRKPVLFAESLGSAQDYFAKADLAFVEVGPGHTLSTLVSMQCDSGRCISIAALPGAGLDESAATDIQFSLGQLWSNGYHVDWHKPFKGRPAGKVSMPGYAFKRDSYWLDAPVQTVPSLASIAATAGLQLPVVTPIQQVSTQQTLTPNDGNQEIPMSAEQHLQSIQQDIRELIEDITGYDLSDLDPEINFGEAGLDSLLLTQVATAIDRKFSVGITFRHLVEEYTSLEELGQFMAGKIPVATVSAASTESTPMTAVGEISTVSPAAIVAAPTGNPLQDLVSAQLQIMQMQLQAFSGGAASPMPAATVSSQVPQKSAAVAESLATESEEKPRVRHTPGTRITRERVGVKLTGAQQDWVDRVLSQYQDKFARSKAHAQKHRSRLADPRTVSGFNPEWKEIVFPIVAEKSSGSKLWDIDGNELIDTSNGFGPILFGHSPEFITEAVKAQLDYGIETGPQSLLAGEVAELFCELTGFERCTFASTGSEAVLGAIRLARTVTGRPKIVMFEGSYHGIFDEVVVRPGRDYQAMPAAPGIPRESTSNMLVLPWGEPESLEAIKAFGPDLAAVLVETVQSRKPEFHDQAYLKALRDITRESDSALIFDEVVTGFRVCAGGIRKYFDIDSDIGTYGKVVGGGHPIGIIGGSARFMDALDGGSWQYGDDSIPEVGVTFFAGTFVRHPVALAAARAVLQKIKAEADTIYPQLAEKTSKMATEARKFITELNCEVTFEEFASFYYVSVPTNAHWGHLLFTLMTQEGIHIQQFRPNFMNTEHSDSDVARILCAFKKSLAQMVLHGLIEGNSLAASKFLQDKPAIPAGARLGKNANGEPAYFIEDPNQKGKYLEVGHP